MFLNAQKHVTPSNVNIPSFYGIVDVVKNQTGGQMTLNDVTSLCSDLLLNMSLDVTIGYIGREGGQWPSGRVLDSRPRGRGFEPHQPHCVVVFEQDTFILT